MISRKFNRLTSTPDISHCESTEDADSGYNTNLSCVNLSVDFSSSGTRSSIPVKTPESIGDSVLASGSSEIQKCNYQLELPIPRSLVSVAYVSNNLCGRDFIDFFYYLGEKNNYPNILKRILSYLSSEDLLKASCTCKSWKNLILTISSERKRLRNFIRRINATKENRSQSSRNDHDVRDCKSLPNRATLAPIENVGRQSSSNSPSSISPVRTNRFEAYRKEGQKLKSGKRLFSCPRCKLPSNVDEKQPEAAQCCNASCKYRICILCQCAEHPDKICHFISTPVVRKQTSAIGTRNSKRNLKRLLM